MSHQSRFICALYFLSLVSCAPEVPSCDPSSSSNVQITDPTPDLYATSITSWAINPWADTPCEYPSNSDSSAIVLVDVDNDSLNDFSISVNHYDSGYPNTPASMCLRYTYTIKVLSLVGGDRIVSVDQSNNYNFNYADYLDSNEVIGYSSHFASSDETYLLYHSSYTGFTTPHWDIPSGNNYIGFKIIRNGNLYFGWMKLEGNRGELTVKSFAIDANSGSCINAGEI